MAKLVVLLQPASELVAVTVTAVTPAGTLIVWVAGLTIPPLLTDTGPPLVRYVKVKPPFTEHAGLQSVSIGATQGAQPAGGFAVLVCVQRPFVAVTLSTIPAGIPLMTPADAVFPALASIVVPCVAI